MSPMAVAYLIAAVCGDADLAKFRLEAPVGALVDRGLLDANYQPTTQGRACARVIETIGVREIERFAATIEERKVAGTKPTGN